MGFRNLNWTENCRYIMKLVNRIFLEQPVMFEVKIVYLEM